MVPKKDGGLRPILDLKGLNKFITYRKFWMVTLQSILPLLKEGDWMASLDLQDTYFYIYIYPEHQAMLRFAIGDLSVQSSPFQSVFGSPSFYKNGGGCTTSPMDQVHSTISLLDLLGLQVNLDKSTLSPYQRIRFIETILDSLQSFSAHRQGTFDKGHCSLLSTETSGVSLGSTTSWSHGGHYSCGGISQTKDEDPSDMVPQEVRPAVTSSDETAAYASGAHL